MQKTDGVGAENDEAWLTCADFIEANIQKIKKEAKKYLHFSAYEMSDFIQESYICAYNTLQSCPCYRGKEAICNPCQPIKCANYKSIFWDLIKLSFNKQVDRYQTKLLSDLPEAYEEDTANQVLTQSFFYQHYPIKNKKKIDKMLKLALQNMTKRQAEAWTQYIYENSETHHEIAVKMNISRQRVAILLKEGVMRAKSQIMLLMGASVKTRYRTFV